MMSDGRDGSAPCEGFADELVELALGTSAGRARSDTLEHVASCPACRAELEQLAKVTEAVQQLAPPMQPPLGFELRLAERLHGAALPAPTRARRPRVLGAAAAAVVILAFGLGALVASRTDLGREHAAASDFVAADLTAGTAVVGSVMVGRGDPGWMLVSTRSGESPGGQWQGEVTCEVTLADGQVQTLGTFTLAGDYGVWATPLTAPASQVRSARLLDEHGSTLASAELDQ